MNDKSFERTLEEIKALFFCTLYLWAVVFVSPLLISYHDFHVLLSPSNYVFSLVYFLCTWGCLKLLIIFQLLIKKKYCPKIRRKEFNNEKRKVKGIWRGDHFCIIYIFNLRDERRHNAVLDLGWSATNWKTFTWMYGPSPCLPSWVHSEVNQLDKRHVRGHTYCHILEVWIVQPLHT
jgi:hypothetical protein